MLLLKRKSFAFLNRPVQPGSSSNPIETALQFYFADLDDRLRVRIIRYISISASSTAVRDRKKSSKDFHDRFRDVESVDRIIYTIFGRFNEDWKNHTLELFTEVV